VTVNLAPRPIAGCYHLTNVMALPISARLSGIFETRYPSGSRPGYPFPHTISGFNIPSQPHSHRYMQYDMYPHELNCTGLHVDAALDMLLLPNVN